MNGTAPAVVVVVGSSCGGHRVLAELFAGLPRGAAAFVVVQHMPAFVNDSLCRRLQGLTAMAVAVARGGERLERGQVLIAPSKLHLSFDRDQVAHLVDGAKVSFARPSIDVTMGSLAQRPGQRLVGVLLTGMGEDGAAGIAHLKGCGAETIVQAPATCTVDGMPRAALATGCVDLALSPAGIRGRLLELLS